MRPPNFRRWGVGGDWRPADIRAFAWSEGRLPDDEEPEPGWMWCGWCDRQLVNPDGGIGSTGAAVRCLVCFVDELERDRGQRRRFELELEQRAAKWVACDRGLTWPDGAGF